MSNIDQPPTDVPPGRRNNRARRGAARRRQAEGELSASRAAEANEEKLPTDYVLTDPIGHEEAKRLGLSREYGAFTGAKGILYGTYGFESKNPISSEEKEKLTTDYIQKRDAFLEKVIQKYRDEYKEDVSTDRLNKKLQELSKGFFKDEQTSIRNALKKSGGFAEFLQTKSDTVRDAMKDAVYGEALEPAPAASAPAAEVRPPKKPEKADKRATADAEALVRRGPATPETFGPFAEPLKEEITNYNVLRQAYLSFLRAENPNLADQRDTFLAFQKARNNLVTKAITLIEGRKGATEEDIRNETNLLVTDFIKNEADALSALGASDLESNAFKTDSMLPRLDASESPDAVAAPAEPPAESETDPKKRKKEKAPPASSTEIEGGPFDIHKGVGQPISSLERPNNFGGATPNTFPLGDLELESLHPDTLDRLRIPNGEYAEIEGLPKPPEEAAAENPDGLLSPEVFGVPEGAQPASERVPLRDQTERVREKLTVDALLVALGSRKKAFGSVISKFQHVEQAYKGHLLQKQRAGKELRLGADAVKLREQYIEARNDLLFSVAQMMRPGAGYVPANEAERNRNPEKQWIDFTMADVAHAFLANEQQELGGADTSFDAVYSILREPVLIRALGPSILKDEAFAGQYGTSMLNKMLNPNTEQFAPGLTDQSVINEFDDARLEFYAALIRKMQKSSANRNALGGKDARFKDFRRSWLDRNDPIFKFNRGRQGFEDRYEKAFEALDKAMVQIVYIDEATQNAARRQFSQFITNEVSIENDIERDRLSRQKRGRVRPLADAIRTNGWNAERLIASAAQSIGRRFPPESAGEPSDEGGEEAAPAPERPASAPEAASTAAYQVKEGETMSTAFGNWLPTMPEAVRNRLLSGLRIDRTLPANIIAARLFSEFSEVKDMVARGAMFNFSLNAARPGLYLISADQKKVKRLTNELGKNLIAPRPESI